MKKNKILIVEDNLNIRETLEEILSINGYEVLTAINGVEGIEYAIKINPDLIISDIMMPEMDGFSLLKKVQENLSNTPFIFLSAKSSMSDLRKGMNNGADDYLVKPFSTTDLLAAVSKRLERINNIKNDTQEKENQVQTKQTLENNIQHKNLKHSISYAENIQQKIFPTQESITKYLPDNFLLYRPKDHLSGDFYWFNQHNDVSLIAAIDCTGHGVPGAMTSMIAYSFLNRAVQEHNLSQPSLILNSLHEQFANYISPDQLKDFNEGMEVGLCQINMAKKQLFFSGARRPLYLVRSKNKKVVEGAFRVTERNGFVLYEIKGDSHSIDAFKAKKYTNHEIELELGDVIYLFSDGFVDQFGGSNNKKIGPFRFRNLLLHIQNKSMDDQKQTLENALDKWQKWKSGKGVIEEQVDDILVMGIKI